MAQPREESLAGMNLAQRLSMSDKPARRHAISEWLLEFSVLWAVFPLLDQ